MNIDPDSTVFCTDNYYRLVDTMLRELRTMTMIVNSVYMLLLLSITEVALYHNRRLLGVPEHN